MPACVGRAVATAYIILLGITTVMEERGLTRSSNLTHDVAQVPPAPSRSQERRRSQEGAALARWLCA